MKQHEFMDLIKEIGTFAFATVDAKNQPQVRLITLMLVEEGKLYFIAARGKDFYKELMANPTVSLTGMNQNWQAVRLTGEVQNIGQDLLDRIFEEYKPINGTYPGTSRKILDVFCIEKATGELFDLGEHPVYRQPFSLGEMPLETKGFVIKEACTSCGICADVCPQSCIDSGTPYVIRQENCLHCGLCAEECPVNAVHPI